MLYINVCSYLRLFGQENNVNSPSNVRKCLGLSKTLLPLLWISSSGCHRAATLASIKLLGIPENSSPCHQSAKASAHLRRSSNRVSPGMSDNRTNAFGTSEKCYGLNPSGNSTCVKLTAISRIRVLRSSPWAHHSKRFMDLIVSKNHKFENISQWLGHTT